jgi:predicted nucleic acid-binding protein
MIVYVESNFVLELALLQEQAESCKGILELCESGHSELVLPAFCIAEPYETLVRRAKDRGKLTQDLTIQAKQLGRSQAYRNETETFRSVTALLVKSGEEERTRLHSVLNRILAIASVIPLTSAVLAEAVKAESSFSLSPQDAVVYASVLHHLKGTSEELRCFLNKNSNDFDDPDIVGVLENYRCKMLPRFDAGLQYIRYRISNT